MQGNEGAFEDYEKYYGGENFAWRMFRTIAFFFSFWSWSGFGFEGFELFVILISE